MKKKELMNIAKKIAAAETVLSTSADQAERDKAKQDILILSSKVTNLTDMCMLDDMVQDILSKSRSNSPNLDDSPILIQLDRLLSLINFSA